MTEQITEITQMTRHEHGPFIPTADYRRTLAGVALAPCMAAVIAFFRITTDEISDVVWVATLAACASSLLLGALLYFKRKQWVTAQADRPAPSWNTVATHTVLLVVLVVAAAVGVTLLVV